MKVDGRNRPDFCCPSMEEMWSDVDGEDERISYADGMPPYEIFPRSCSLREGVWVHWQNTAYNDRYLAIQHCPFCGEKIEVEEQG